MTISSRNFIARTGWTLVALAGALMFALLAASAFADAPDQAARWKAARVDPRRIIELDKLIARYQNNVAPYQAVEKMHANGVPPVVAFCLFYRECDNNFRCSPAQGNPLTRRSYQDPKGRIPGKNPPFLWNDAAYDAYYVVDHLDRTDWHSLPSAFDKMESFNGFGYRSKGIPAPYLWSATSLYGVPGAPVGKFTSDHHFDRNARDEQAGVAAILKRMQERGMVLPF